MTYTTDDVHHRTSLRLGQIIPNFIEGEYPQFVEFIKSYYTFLEQYDTLPIASVFAPCNGVVTVLSNNSTIVGTDTDFIATLSAYQRIRVGSDTFTVRSIANTTSIDIFQIPTRAYYANTFACETQKTTRQASGALRQLPQIVDIATTLSDFIPYFKETYLKNIPYGSITPQFLIPKILDFYQARGSEEGYKFLFRAFYNTEVELAYPFDRVFTTSDSTYVIPTVIRLSSNTIAGNATLFETRQVIGLSSNAIATVSTVSRGYVGASEITTLILSDVKAPTQRGDLLLDGGVHPTDALIATQYGVPPNGSASSIYDFNLVTEEATSGAFIAGEIVSTLPVEDPLAIRGQIVGSVSGFVINGGGVNYKLGDLVYAPPGFAGGYGAIGKVTKFTSTDVSGITIESGGDGYYANVILTIDNSGTGGSGLAGRVSQVSAGNIILNDDPLAVNNADGDNLVFVAGSSSNGIDAAPDNEELGLQSTWQISFTAERERVTYYELGISLQDILSINPVISSTDWSSGDSVSPLYNTNLTTPIYLVTSAVTTVPFYVNGKSNVEIGEITGVTITNYGSNYILASPMVSVPTPSVPTSDEAGLLPLSSPDYVFSQASLLATRANGQIGQIDVISSGAAYANTTNSFFVNTSTSTTTTGSGANVSIVVQGMITMPGYFTDTKSQVSDNRYIQDESKYQPFAYELIAEKDLSEYEQTVKELVHPAGGLLLSVRTITTELSAALTTDDFTMTTEIVTS